MGVTYINPYRFGVPFSPLDLSPALWLDASDTSTITASSGAVSQWNDKSGNARNVTQATAAAQPKTGNTTLNGLNVIDFDGSDDVLSSSSVTLAYSMSLFMVVNVAAGTYMLMSHGTGNASSNGTFYIFTSSPTVRRVETAAGAVRNTVTTSITGAWKYLTVISAPSTQTVTRLNGASIYSLQSTGTISGWSNSAAIAVGARTDGFWMSGSIAEIILVESAVSTTQRDLTEQYLKTKWGL